MEFAGTIGVALYGLRSARNAGALAGIGVFILIDVKWSTDPLGLVWSALNAAVFVGYIVFGHRAAQSGAGGRVERLGAIAIAFVILVPIGIVQAAKAFGDVELVLAGIGVGAAPRSSPISAISSPCGGCRSPASRCSWHCCLPPRPSLPHWCWRRYHRCATLPGSAWSWPALRCTRPPAT